jgi:pimeloyl-ACP methyl ester carboxylesterase
MIQSLLEAGLRIMMGHRQVEQAALFYEFSLERHVPQDHLLRSIDRFVELGDLRRELTAFYSTMGGPVVLVGHSYGGSVITEAGNHPNVAALVYIAAFALDAGESCATIEQGLPQASKAFKPDSNGNWWIEPERFAADFAADLPKDKAEFMAVSQVPISTDAFTHKVSNPAWRSKPTWYMLATQDRSINPEQERMMAKRARAKTVEVNSSHVAYLSHPKETAKLIEEAATSVTASQ